MDLDRARILVVNDDGINAPGLKVLERIARGLSRDVWVFAPETEQSGASHAFTLTGAIRVQRMVAQMDEEGFGYCTNTYECEAACPVGIKFDNIAGIRREVMKASFVSTNPTVKG